MIILIHRNISLKYDQGLHARTESTELKISPSCSRAGVCGDPVPPCPHTPHSHGQTHNRWLRAQPRAGRCIRRSLGPNPACPGITQGASKPAPAGDPAPREYDCTGLGSGVRRFQRIPGGSHMQTHVGTARLSQWMQLHFLWIGLDWSTCHAGGYWRERKTAGVY